jgi:UDP-N-acetylglucosamine--N-acetylmuramyl-(pentapeptide) pyrophosphoryl-undecaprenol N-acetylglucosamine transferase
VRGLRYKDMFGDIPVHVLRAGTLGAGVMGKVAGLVNLGLGCGQALRLLKNVKPDIVVGFGGYPAFPAVFMAQRLKIATIIHEQNAIIGKANLFLAPKADRIALSTSRMEGLDETDAVRVIQTGNPVRDEIASLYNKPYPALQVDGPLKIFVMGGSQGASVFSEIVPQTIEKLSASHRARLEIVQQCREEDIEQVRGIYERLGVKAELAPFFDDVAGIMADSHLIITRSGASTVAEVSAAGRPAIFVPYPHHKDQQQKMNADVIADAGGAWVMTQDGFTVEALLARLEVFLQNPETLFRTAEAARQCGKPDAARRLGNLVVALASGWDKKARRSFDLTQGHEG